jgi:protein ImuB
VERVDVVAFSARGAAEKFITDLGARSLACACVELEVTTENGELLVRRWRQTGVLTAADVIDRIRWQVEGWLQHHGDGDSQLPSAGIARLRIAPIEVVSTGTHQQSLWGGDGESAARAQRALARVQTMIGFDAVVRPMVAGGRGPAQRTESVPWGLETAGLETAGLETAGLETAGLKTGRLETPGVDPALVRVSGRNPDDPWPGRLPSPAPSVVLDPPTPVRLLDGTGRSVVVSERGAVTHPPARLGIGQRSLVPVASWAGPWPADERWWDPVSAARVARVQLVDVHGRAYLLAGEMAGDREPRWVLEGIYD